MKLRIARDTQDLIVKLELETVNFTDQENLMLDQMGEPIVVIDKNYGSNHVKFRKKIRRGFKTRQEFDARLDSPKQTAIYVEQFIADVTKELEREMKKLALAYEVELTPRKQTIEINY